MTGLATGGVLGDFAVDSFGPWADFAGWMTLALGAAASVLAGAVAAVFFSGWAAGAFAVSAAAPDPQTVSAATGKVAYRLFLSGAPGFAPPPDQRGLLIVQMLDSARIRVEVFAGSTASDAEFTSAARVYVR